VAGTISYRSFENTDVHLDGTVFQGCSFKDVVFIYGGGSLPDLSDCSIDGCSWKFEDAADRTIILIRALAQAMGPEGQAFVEKIFLRPQQSSPPTAEGAG
jgi:hypothetical protein